ncbi:unnamed protein product [Symbiodinium sp. CCMP2592]|nr:unnamed protein product [Symbiodinium sp. CCMP2592]
MNFVFRLHLLDELVACLSGCHLSWGSGWEVADHGPREKLSADTFMRRARPDPPEDPLPVSKRKSKSGKRKAGLWLNADYPLSSDEPVQPNASTSADVMGPKLGAFALKAFKVPTKKQLEFWQTDSESMPVRHHLPNPKEQRMTRQRHRHERWSGDWPPAVVKEEAFCPVDGPCLKEVKKTDADSKLATAAESGDWQPGGVKEEVVPQKEDSSPQVKTTDADSKLATAAESGDWQPGGVKEEVAPKEDGEDVANASFASVCRLLHAWYAITQLIGAVWRRSGWQKRARKWPVLLFPHLPRQAPSKGTDQKIATSLHVHLGAVSFRNPKGEGQTDCSFRNWAASGSQRRVKEEVVPEKEVQWHCLKEVKMTNAGSNVSAAAAPAGQHHMSVRPQDHQELPPPWRRRTIRRQLRLQPPGGN